jgi:serine/threonine protein kinase
MVVRMDNPIDLGDRYRIDRLLGKGGMGAVYLAYDQQRDITVAVKIHHAAGPELHATTIRHEAMWIKREFRMMTEMRHRNLVEFYDLVVHPTRTFFSMEYVDGITVNKWVRPDGEVDFSRVYHVARSMVDALAYLHAHGVVHRDIKPSNILVSRQGEVKLLDFGVALSGSSMAAIDRQMISSVEGIGKLTGTLPYLAPEYISDLCLSCCIDIYAFGVLLFELCTSKVPFKGSLAEIANTQQRVALAPRASLYNSRVPSQLDQLIADVLAFDREQRPSASALAKRLGPSSSNAEFVLPKRRAQFVGRQRELDVITAALSPSSGALRHNDPNVARLIIVEGCAGVGKTTLVRKIVNEQGPDLLSWRGRCYGNEHVAYRAFDAIVDDMACDLDDRSFASLQSSHGRESLLAPHVVAVFPCFGRGLQVGNPDAIEVTPAMRSAAHLHFVDVLRRLLADRRGILVIEELHNADGDSLRLLTDVLSSAVSGLTVIATITMNQESDLSAAIGSLRSSGHTLIVKLDDLSADEQQQMIEQLMPDAKTSARRRVAELAMRNPLLVELYAEEALVQSAISTATMELPMSALLGLSQRDVEIHDATSMRVERFGAAARDVAQWLAVIGCPSTVMQLRALTHQTETDVHTGLRDLDRAGMVRSGSSASGQSHVSLVHSGVAASIYRSLSQRRRVALHRQVATWYTQQRNIPDAASHVAHHYGEAGQHEVAAQWCVKAGNIALSRGAAQTAKQWFQRGRLEISCCTSGDVAVIVRGLERCERRAQQLLLLEST